MKARALYDNSSETSDELNFLRNDILEVLEKDYDGMEGWWLCELKGRTGIAPANRLVIITMAESPTADYCTPKSKLSSPPNTQKTSLITDDYDSPIKSNIALNSPSVLSSTSSPSSLNKKITESIKSEKKISQDDYDIPIKITQPKNETGKTAGKTPDHSPRNSCEPNPNEVYNGYKSHEKQLSLSVAQINQMMGKWKECANIVSITTVVRVVCVSFWNKLQAYTAEGSKLVAMIRRSSIPDALASLDAVKSSSRQLENVLDNLNKSNFSTGDEAKLSDILVSIDGIVGIVLNESKFLNEFFERAQKEKLYRNDSDNEKNNCNHNSGNYNNSNIINNNSRGSSNLLTHSTNDLRDSNQFGDYDTPRRDIYPSNKTTILKNLHSTSPKYIHQHKQNQRNTTDSGISSEMSDYDRPRTNEGLDYDQPISSLKSSSTRPRSTDILDGNRKRLTSKSISISKHGSSEVLDYDLPNSRPTNLNETYSPGSILNQVSPPIKYSTDRKINKYNSLDCGLDYDTPVPRTPILYRPNQTPPNFSPGERRTGLIVSSEVQENKSKKDSNYFNNSGTRIVSFEALDYDYPTYQPEKCSLKNVPVSDCTVHLSECDKDLLRYNRPYLNEEVKNMEGLILNFEKHIALSSTNQTSNVQPILLVNDVKSLAASAHKILFTFDFILKKVLNQPEFTRQINNVSSKICESLKSLTNTVKQVIQRQNDVIPTQQLEHLLRTMVDLKDVASVISTILSFWV